MNTTLSVDPIVVPHSAVGIDYQQLLPEGMGAFLSLHLPSGQITINPCLLDSHEADFYRTEQLVLPDDGPITAVRTRVGLAHPDVTTVLAWIAHHADTIQQACAGATYATRDNGVPYGPATLTDDAAAALTHLRDSLTTPADPMPLDGWTLVTAAAAPTHALVGIEPHAGTVRRLFTRLPAQALAEQLRATDPGLHRRAHLGARWGVLVWIGDYDANHLPDFAAAAAPPTRPIDPEW